MSRETRLLKKLANTLREQQEQEIKSTEQTEVKQDIQKEKYPVIPLGKFPGDDNERTSQDEHQRD